MHLLRSSLILFLIFHLALSEASSINKNESYNFLLAESSIRKAYDPFIDYTEFQDTVTEQQNINFFQSGRSLSLNLFGGYESVTLTMRELYGDSFNFLGASIAFFFDLNISFQISVGFPRTHFNSITQSSHSFSSYYFDFKYYFNRQNLVKGLSFLNPYVTFGPFFLRIKLPIIDSPQIIAGTPGGPPPIAIGLSVQNQFQGAPQNTVAPPTRNKEEQHLTGDHTAYGLKIGLGVEIPLIKQVYMGLEANFYYANLLFENEDLSDIQLAKAEPAPYYTILDRLLTPPQPPNLNGLRFYGDLFNTMLLLGVNF